MKPIHINNRQYMDTTDEEREQYRELTEKQGLVEIRRPHPHISGAVIVENAPKDWAFYDGFQWKWKQPPQYRAIEKHEGSELTRGIYEQPTYR